MPFLRLSGRYEVRIRKSLQPAQHHHRLNSHTNVIVNMFVGLRVRALVYCFHWFIIFTLSDMKTFFRYLRYPARFVNRTNWANAQRLTQRPGL